jgi:MinD-like ATPase involved in chromosome partitioning or flagellar assembly
MTLSAAATGVFDGLAARIDAAALRSIGFTSSVSGEGVTTIALGTAMSLAALRRDPVLLIDANWPEPSLTADAACEATAGLADYLAKHVDLDDVIQPTRHHGLAFLPVGDRMAARPTFRALSSFVEDDTHGFGTIVVDLPPLIGGDPFVLPWAGPLDQLFVILREAATPLALVRQALDRVGLATMARIVLNRVDAPSAVFAPTLVLARA